MPAGTICPATASIFARLPAAGLCYDATIGFVETSESRVLRRGFSLGGDCELHRRFEPLEQRGRRRSKCELELSGRHDSHRNLIGEARDSRLDSRANRDRSLNRRIQTFRLRDDFDAAHHAGAFLMRSARAAARTVGGDLRGAIVTESSPSTRLIGPPTTRSICIYRTEPF
jgi:hypothetical protein